MLLNDKIVIEYNNVGAQYKFHLQTFHCILRVIRGNPRRQYLRWLLLATLRCLARVSRELWKYSPHNSQEV